MRPEWRPESRRCEDFNEGWNGMWWLYVLNKFSGNVVLDKFLPVQVYHF